MTAPNLENRCFGCGGGNPRGMQLAFERDEEQQRISGRFRLGPEWQGGPGFLHGGIIATVLDEALGKVNRFHGVVAVTAELNIEYHRPIRVDEEIVVEAFHLERNGQQLWHAGEIRSAAGKVLAKAKGRFVVIDPEKYAKELPQR